MSTKKIRIAKPTDPSTAGSAPAPEKRQPTAQPDAVRQGQKATKARSEALAEPGNYEPAE